MKGAVLVMVMAVLACGFQVPSDRRIGAPIVATAAPVYDALAALQGGERFPQGAQLIRIEDGQSEPLINGFYATADVDVSFDATRILFAGKQSSTRPWQVWEFTLADHSVRQVVHSTTDAVRPLYLPGNRLVFAQRGSASYRILSANLDGSRTLPLTYMSASALPSTVLLDGRILFQSGYPLNTGDTPELYLVYSDGSGLESYRCDHGPARWGGTQLSSGDVVFTHGPSLARFTSPQAEEVPVAAPLATYAASIVETSSGDWVMSARTSIDTHFALKLWKPGSPNLQPVFRENGEDIVEPVLLSPRTVPNLHPSALHDWTTANLLALDARESRNGPLTQEPSFVEVETMNDDGQSILLGRAPIESDGSFFIQIPGDHPLRLTLLDARGTVLRQEQGWFWSRGGEQRICVGCHTGPERAPENRVPGVLLRTTTPVDLTGSLHAISKGGN